MRKGNKMGKLCGNSILQHLKCQTKSLCFTRQWKEAKGEAQRVLTDGGRAWAPSQGRRESRGSRRWGGSVVKYRAGCLTRSECSKCSLLLPPPSHPRHAGLSHSYERANGPSYFCLELSLHPAPYSHSSFLPAASHPSALPPVTLGQAVSPARCVCLSKRPVGLLQNTHHDL